MFKTHRIPTRDFTDFLRWSVLTAGVLTLAAVLMAGQGIVNTMFGVGMAAFLAGGGFVQALWYATEYRRDFKSCNGGTSEDG